METIRQSCPQCGSTLELPSSAVGRIARCPACQHTFRVPGNGPAVGPAASPSASAHGSVFDPQPAAKAPAEATSPSQQGQTGGVDLFGGTSQSSQPAATYSGNPYAASGPPVAASYNNPYAFSPSMASTSALQVDRAPIEVRTASIDQIVSSSLSIFSARWQPLVLAGLIYFVLSILATGANFAIGAVVEMNGLDFGPIYLFAAGIVASLITWYFSLGLMNVALQAARGIETGPSNAFVSLNIFGRLFVLILVLAVIGSSPNLLALLAEGENNEMTGAVLTLVGLTFVGLITGLVLWTIWPIFFLVVDERSAEGGGLSLAFQIGTNNLLNGFLMALIAIVMGVAATFTCGLGAIVTQPLMMLVAAVGYLLMTSQPVSDPAKTPYQMPNYGA